MLTLLQPNSFNLKLTEYAQQRASEFCRSMLLTLPVCCFLMNMCFHDSFMNLKYWIYMCDTVNFLHVCKWNQRRKQIIRELNHEIRWVRPHCDWRKHEGMVRGGVTSLWTNHLRLWWWLQQFQTPVKTHQGISGCADTTSVHYSLTAASMLAC